MTTCKLCCCDPCNPAIDGAVQRLHAAWKADLAALFVAPEPRIDRRTSWPSEVPPSERPAVQPGETRVKRKRSEDVR